MDALVKIFPDNACPAEHWGYIFKGKVRVEYTDGQEEILSAGDAFYIPSGHRPYMLEETELLQLTRKSDHNGLVRKFTRPGCSRANDRPNWPAGHRNRWRRASAGPGRGPAGP
jgi:hypothetical protein